MLTWDDEQREETKQVLPDFIIRGIQGYWFLHRVSFRIELGTDASEIIFELKDQLGNQTAAYCYGFYGVEDFDKDEK